MTITEQNEYYTAEELAEVLRIKRKTLYTQISNGKFPIPYFKLGKSLLFLIADVSNYINSCRIEANIKPIKNESKFKTKPIKNNTEIKETEIIKQRIRVR